MKEYRIKRVSGAPDWSNIPTLAVDSILWLPDANVRMTQQLCYDDTAIYVHQRVVEQHIRAEESGPMAMVCFDSCMEFFFCPDPNSDRYFNFEWNPDGGLYLGLRSGHELYVRLQPEDPVALFEYRSQRTDDGWEIFYKIPLSFINLIFPEFQLASGTAFRANCFKCGDRTVQPHYLSWNPCTSDYPRFHLVSDFGRMILE